jgi:hypothetical protein
MPFFGMGQGGTAAPAVNAVQGGGVAGSQRMLDNYANMGGGVIDWSRYGF